MAILKKIIRGDTISLPITVKENGVPIDISGNIFTLTLKYSLDDEDSAAAFSVSITAPNDSETQAGRITLTVGSDVTESLIPTVDDNRAWYDLERRIPGTPDIVTTYEIAQVPILADATQGA